MNTIINSAYLKKARHQVPSQINGFKFFDQVCAKKKSLFQNRKS